MKVRIAVLTRDCFHSSVVCPNKVSRIPGGPQYCPSQSVECPSIVSRSVWGAREPNGTTVMTTPVEYVIVHHTATGNCSSTDSCSRILRDIQKYHMDERNGRFSDIGYSFLVGGDGKVYEGRGWNKQGAHTKNYNDKGIGIAFIGNFQSELLKCTKESNAAQELITCGAEMGMVKWDYKLLGHQQTKATECPGKALFDIIKTSPRWVLNP
ncbi:hypothetical protein J437_LFUL015023 [Ladona fulva]|uniref:Peptidoglycan-recognition protein n=1 Tax=Ladona fulva TaxID=123851 RepID=A0A8K0K9J7_LADFU|nr:hypothetical protein J437_LFUL015023 [Ladona fulva]